MGGVKGNDAWWDGWWRSGGQWLWRRDMSKERDGKQEIKKKEEASGRSRLEGNGQGDCIRNYTLTTHHTQIFWAYSGSFNEAVKMKNDPVKSNNSRSKEANFSCRAVEKSGFCADEREQRRRTVFEWKHGSFSAAKVWKGFTIAWIDLPSKVFDTVLKWNHTRCTIDW